MIISRLDVSLKGFEVGLSGAIPDRRDWNEAAEDRAILEFISLLSALVFKYGGRIVHGAHPTFTPVILRQAEVQARDREQPAVTLVMSELWAKDLDSFERDEYEKKSKFIVVPQVGQGEPEDPTVRNASLTALRRELVQRMNVMVAVGGKSHTDDGLIPGVAEELALAEHRQMPCFLVGGLGGMAGRLATEAGDYVSQLRNDLPDDSNRELLTTKDVGGCVSLVFDALANNSAFTQRKLLDVRGQSQPRAR
jgi:hypothetical protein